MKKSILILFVAFCIQTAWCLPYSKSTYKPIKALANILALSTDCTGAMPDTQEPVVIGQVVFKQDSPSDFLQVEVSFTISPTYDDTKPSDKYILIIHKHRVLDPISLDTAAGEKFIRNEECVRLGGNPHNKFFDPMMQFGGDFGVMQTGMSGINIEFRNTSEFFTLYGKESILGRSIILYKLIRDDYFDSTKRIAFFPPQVARVISCDTIGLFPIPFGEIIPEPRPHLNIINLNYRQDNYGSYEKPRTALAFLSSLSRSEMEKFTNPESDRLIVLFEQENSYAPLRVTGLGYTNFSSVGDKLRVAVKEFKTLRDSETFELINSINEEMEVDLSGIRCGRPFLPFGSCIVSEVGSGAIDSTDSRPGISFLFNHTIATLYGENSIVGRTLQLHNGVESRDKVALFDIIGLVTPCQEIYNIIIRYLKTPVSDRTFNFERLVQFFVDRLTLKAEEENSCTIDNLV